VSSVDSSPSVPPLGVGGKVCSGGEASSEVLDVGQSESKIALRRAEARRKMPAQVPSLWAFRAVRAAARRGHRASVSLLFSSVPGGLRQGRMITLEELIAWLS